MKTTQELYEYLNSNQLAVLSTVNSAGRPNAAIVGFGQTSELRIIFGTDTRSRKYSNIFGNPFVAFAIGGQTPETIQYEGTARQLEEFELDIVRQNYWQKNPHAEVHHNNPSGCYFIVQPTWIRYTDVRANPWDITELTF
jgi:general stress protein 26